MTAYIKLSTLEFPRHEGDIRLEHPEITQERTGDSFPCPDTHALVGWVAPPEHDPKIQRCAQGAPENVDGAWRVTWSVRDATAEEIEQQAEWERTMIGNAP
jgi:hypothetical protein